MPRTTRRTRPTKPRPDLSQEVTDRIIAALEAGVAPWVCPWDRSGGAPTNGTTGRAYSGINIMLLALAGFGDHRWCTYHQAKQAGGQVRRGEKGTRIIFWRFVEPKGAADGDDNRDAQDSKHRNSRRIPLLRSFTVFNFDQIDWPEGHRFVVEPDKPTVDVHAGHEAAAALIGATGADIRHGGTRAYYRPSEDRIQLPEPERFDDASSYWATALHELTHWTGHESRLHRSLSGRFGSESYAAEELVAELGAAYLCAEVGVAGKLQHAEYLGSWIKVLKDDKRAIFTASRLATEAARYVLAQADTDAAAAPQDAEDAPAKAA